METTVRMYHIESHRVTSVPYTNSPNQSGDITPRFIVMHYTAGWTAESAIATLTRRGSNASAHFVVDLDGKLTQLVPMNRKAWHAGPSKYEGYSGLNSHSIGIEIVNIGFLKKVGDRYMDDYGVLHHANEGYLKDVVLIEAKHPRVGSGTYYWPAYTQAQLDTVEYLTRTIALEYPIIDVISHEEIDTRGWKTDPGPAFPMARYKRIVQDRAGDTDEYIVTASSLNVRSGPGTDFTVTARVVRGDIVPILDRRGDWARITAEGWVHSAYLKAD